MHYQLGQELRLRFIEALACWEAGVSTTRVATACNISRVQAHRDIQNHPAEMFKDGETGLYVPATGYFYGEDGPDINEYLGFLYYTSKPDWLYSFGLPGHSIRKINRQSVSKIIYAMQRGHLAEVSYQALESAREDVRTIRPIKMINTGFRWHIRALREKDGELAYRDFLLTRFTRFHSLIRSGFSKEPEDENWNTPVTIVFRINRKIRNRERRRIIADEFGMGEKDYFEIQTNAAMAKYIPEMYTVDMDSTACHYEKNLLEIWNMSEVRRYLLKPGELCDDEGI